MPLVRGLTFAFWSVVAVVAALGVVTAAFLADFYVTYGHQERVGADVPSPREAIARPTEPIGAPTSPPGTPQVFDAQTRVSARIGALLDGFTPSHDDDSSTEDWNEIQAQRRLAFNWCAERVAEHEGTSVAASAQILRVATSSFDAPSVEIVLRTLETRRAQLDPARRRQCAALLYLADPSTH